MIDQDVRLRRFGASSVAFICTQLGADWGCCQGRREHNAL